MSAYWVVPGGFTNTGLCALPDGALAIGNFDAGTIVIADNMGALISTVTLASPPASSIQGVAWDTSRSHYWVSHYAATNGTLRRYDASGALQQTISPARGVAGPNGCFYDTVNDRIVAAYSDGVIKGYACSTGTEAESITVASGLITGGVLDGVTIDPSDATRLWVSVDASVIKIGKINRSTGAEVLSWACAKQPESLAWLDGYLYMCSDQLYHDSLPNGNRVYRYTATGLPVAFHTRDLSFCEVYG